MQYASKIPLKFKFGEQFYFSFGGSSFFLGWHMIKKSRFFFPRTFWVLQYELRSGPSQRQRWRTINSRDDWKSHQNTSEKPKRILPVCRRYLGCISILILLLNWITKSQVEAKAEGDKWKTLFCLFAKFWPFINRTGPGFEGLFYIVARVQKIAK